LFGFFKGVLIISLVLTCLNVVYKDKKPNFLSKSIISKIVDRNAETLTEIINSLLGNFIKEGNTDLVKMVREEKNTSPTPKHIKNDVDNGNNKFDDIKYILESEFPKNIKIDINTGKINKPDGETDLDKLINIFLE
jgi:hypothetical protein